MPMYSVAYGTETHEFDSRMEAIEAAKEMSDDKRGTVMVQDETEREQLIYKYGELDSYTLDLRRRRK